MNTGNSGIGLYNPNGTLKLPPIQGQPRPLQIYGHAHLNFGDYFWARNQPPFGPWEVALTVIAAAIMVAVVVVFVRRLRPAE